MAGAGGGRQIRYERDVPPAEGAAEELADGVLWLSLPLPMPPGHVNVYALDDGDGWTLVDTGLDSRRGRALWARLLEGPLGGRPVRRVVATHHHLDHIGLAGWFQAEHGAELLTSRTAWLFARMLTLDEQAEPTPEMIAFWRGAGMAAEILEERRRQRPFNFADGVAPLPLGFARLEDGGVLSAGGRDWDIRFGQGHAPDHVTLWSRDDALVLGGDQLLPSISPNIGVYATEPQADPLGEWLEACTRLAAFARADHLVLPGHKLPYRGLPARLAQMTENHLSALDRLRDRLKRPHRAVECFPVLYKRPIGRGEYGLALVEAVAHLNHLLRKGDVTRQMGQDGAWLYQRR